MADHSESREARSKGDPSASSDDPATPEPQVAKGRRHPPATQRKTPRPVRSLAETRGPDPDTPLADVWLTIGRIAGIHGVHGDLKVRLLTDHPEHVLTLKHVYLGESREPVTMTEARLQPPIAIVHLKGVDTPEDAKALGGLPLRIPATDAKPLEEGEYFLFQLVGLQAVNGEGAHLGAVTDLMETGAHDVFVITPEGAGASDQLLVPNHPQYVLRIAPDEGLIVIEPPVYGN